MQLILIQDVNHLGAINEIVKVKNGYGRNYLIPQKFAIEATPSALKQLEEKIKIITKKEEKMLAEIQQVMQQLSALKLLLKTKVGTTGKIFGSISTVMIARQMKEQLGYQIERKRISIPETIKEIGVYEGEVNFGKDKIAKFSFEIIAE